MRERKRASDAACSLTPLFVACGLPKTCPEQPLSNRPPNGRRLAEEEQRQERERRHEARRCSVLHEARVVAETRLDDERPGRWLDRRLAPVETPVSGPAVTEAVV